MFKPGQAITGIAICNGAKYNANILWEKGDVNQIAFRQKGNKIGALCLCADSTRRVLVDIQAI